MGPVFISIGDSDQINLFLDKNPRVPRGMLLADDYAMNAYRAAGFSTIGYDARKLVTEKRTMKMPKFSFSRQMDYLFNAAALAPVAKGPMRFPEGVLMNGGTFGVRGDRIVYAYSDAVPGDHPNPADVIASFGAK